MIHNSVTVRGTRVILLVVNPTSILAKIYPSRRGYVPPLFSLLATLSEKTLRMGMGAGEEQTQFPTP